MKKILLTLIICLSIGSTVAKENSYSNVVNVLKKAPTNSSIHQTLNSTSQKSGGQSCFQQCLSDFNYCLNSNNGSFDWWWCEVAMEQCINDCL